MNWVLEHMGDPDFSTPFQPPTQTSSASASGVDEENVAMVMSLGFTKEQAVRALQATVGVASG